MYSNVPVISIKQVQFLFYRDANSLLAKAKQGDLESVNAIYGTFACHVSNIAGTGDKCSISIDGPPSALVADTDTTYLIFGGASVILLLFIIVGSIVVCRRHSVSKYGSSGGGRNAPSAASASTLAQGYDFNISEVVNSRTLIIAGKSSSEKCKAQELLDISGP